MSIRVDDTVSYVNGIHVGNRGLGMTGAYILSSAIEGEHGLPPLVNDITSGVEDNDEFVARISSVPTNGGILLMDENSAFSLSVVPNSFTYNLVKNGTTTTANISVTIQATYSPGSDITTTGWTATPGPSYYSAIDENAASTTDYITSPNTDTPPPITLGWATPVPAGTYQASIHLEQGLGIGSEVRIVLLNSSNDVVGTSSWIIVPESYTTVLTTFTCTGTSDKFRIEVQ